MSITTANATNAVLERLGVRDSNPGASLTRFLDTRGPDTASINPATGEVLWPS